MRCLLRISLKVQKLHTRLGDSEAVTINGETNIQLSIGIEDPSAWGLLIAMVTLKLN